MSPASHILSSPLMERTHAHLDELASAQRQAGEKEFQLANGAPPNQESGSSLPQSLPSAPSRIEKEYVSKIGVLTSSLPMYHNQFMRARKADLEKTRLQQQSKPQEHREAEMLSSPSLEAGSPERSTEEQAETVRRLKPHSRSTIQLQNIMANAANPESVVLDMRSKSKHKTPRWQFGIRSRNEPVDAIKCLYKALESMGDCQWHVNPPRHDVQSQKLRLEGPFPVNVKGATHLNTKEAPLSESPEKDRRLQRSVPATTNGTASRTKDGSKRTNGDITPTEFLIEDGFDSERDEDIDPNETPEEYAPKDPWCIHVRWEKKGMSPPGALSSSSAQSSKVDLVSNDGSNRRGSALGSLSSAQGSVTSFAGGDTVTNFNDTACFVYMDLQIYVLEADTYLVDFKSAGYESIVGERQIKNYKGEISTEYIGSGNRKADKDVTSPQPFLDLANKLVIHLAKGAQ